MDYLTVKETGIKWGVSKRRVLVLCSQNRIPGTIKMAPLWLIPATAEKPADGFLRYLNATSCVIFCINKKRSVSAIP